MERTHLTTKISFIEGEVHCVCVWGIPVRFRSTLGGRSGNLPRQVEQKRRSKTGKQMYSLFADQFNTFNARCSGTNAPTVGEI